MLDKGQALESPGGLLKTCLPSNPQHRIWEFVFLAISNWYWCWGLKTPLRQHFPTVFKPKFVWAQPPSYQMGKESLLKLWGILKHLVNLTFSGSYTFLLLTQFSIWKAGSSNMRRYFHFTFTDWKYPWLIYSFKLLQRQRISDRKGHEDLATSLGTQCNRIGFKVPNW